MHEEVKFAFFLMQYIESDVLLFRHVALPTRNVQL